MKALFKLKLSWGKNNDMLLELLNMKPLAFHCYKEDTVFPESTLLLLSNLPSISSNSTKRFFWIVRQNVKNLFL